MVKERAGNQLKISSQFSFNSIVTSVSRGEKCRLRLDNQESRRLPGSTKNPHKRTRMSWKKHLGKKHRPLGQEEGKQVPFDQHQQSIFHTSNTEIVVLQKNRGMQGSKKTMKHVVVDRPLKHPNQVAASTSRGKMQGNNRNQQRKYTKQSHSA
ncbi:hypothetical protein Nepgr_033577 [Nepenthes gracilis]|uniref:Uncharacterized protein n=1 Tax=Nepenthes gracilis TaxID=150966 RepID=A0AAD3TMK2_NEPGR|nr:hypothetical protein Nepgr_033577 [Nepenthes gracilis]